MGRQIHPRGSGFQVLLQVSLGGPGVPALLEKLHDLPGLKLGEKSLGIWVDDPTYQWETCSDPKTLILDDYRYELCDSACQMVIPGGYVLRYVYLWRNGSSRQWPDEWAHNWSVTKEGKMMSHGLLHHKRDSEIRLFLLDLATRLCPTLVEQ